MYMHILFLINPVNKGQPVPKVGQEQMLMVLTSSKVGRGCILRVLVHNRN